MDTSLARLVTLEGHRLGPVQRSGPMSIVPVFGESAGERYLPPLTALKLSRVAGYGSVELECRSTPSGEGIGIVPLHIGYIQDGAQNHALCRAALMAPGQKRMFDDACCVQQTQGGYLEGREQWFFVLPLHLRDEALRRRGEVAYGKLWPAIARLNEQFGKSSRGHLEDVICRERPYLGQYVGRFERLPGQLGALFFLSNTLVGIEIAPNEAFFAEMWMPLACFCYGVAAMHRERKGVVDESPPIEAKSLPELRSAVLAGRRFAEEVIAGALASIPEQRFSVTEEERLLDVELVTAVSEHFSGQIVQECRGDKKKLVYASLAARRSWFADA